MATVEASDRASGKGWAPVWEAVSVREWGKESGRSSGDEWELE